MEKMMTYEFLLLVFVTFVSSIVSMELSPGAEQCFNNNMVGTKRRVKVAFCDTDGTHLENKGYAFQNQDTTTSGLTKLEIRVGNVLFNTNPKILRTVLMKNTEVQICMYGELDTDRLRGPARLQISAHGKPQSFPPVAGVKINLPDLGIDADFCDLKPNGCTTTEPSCSEMAPGGGVKPFCSCATLTVPDYAPAGTDVEVTWKLLEIPSEADPNACEQKFDIDQLFKNDKKETLACLKIPATVKACKQLSDKAKTKIIGC